MFQTMLRPGLLSAFILTTFSRPAHAAATSSNTESRIRQGLLQAAENTTRTGCFHLSTSDAKFASSISMIGPLFGFVFISSTAFQIHQPRVLGCSSANVAGVAGRIGQAVRTNALLPNQPAESSTPERRHCAWRYLLDVLHAAGLSVSNGSLTGELPARISRCQSRRLEF